MSDLRREYDIVFENEKLGCAVVAQVGIRFEISAEISGFRTKNPFRLAAKCGGKNVTLGVMLPQKGSFAFRKVYTKSSLRELGISAIEGFTLVKDGDNNTNKYPQNTVENMSKWSVVEDMSEYLEDGEFRRRFSVHKNCLAYREGEFAYIAVPMIKGETLPKIPVLCLGETRKINGKMHMVFKTRRGKLLF